MYAQTTLHLSLSAEDANSSVRQANQLFDRIFSEGRLQRLIKVVFGRAHRLFHLGEFEQQHEIGNRFYAGTMPVELDQIHGTLDRADSFDRDFRPLHESDKARWASVAQAMQAGKTLPPVELIKAGDDYYVVDGHHRISVARALRMQAIDAQVTVWQIR
jgi:hypothetical protein